MIAAAAVPYCGAPPTPATLAARWNLDPLLLGLLAGALLLYLIAAQRRRVLASERLVFVTGWAIATLALVSPLCAASVSLFAARVAQHMILTLVAAPLLALGWPPSATPPPLLRFMVAGFAVMLWFWHMPEPYALTFSDARAYWIMHLSLFGSAFGLWRLLLHPGSAARLSSGAFFSFVQMGLLGALITLAPRALYTPHLQTTAIWGLSPIADQQLGGAIMWVLSGLVFVGATLYGAIVLLDREPPHGARWPRP